MFNNALIKELKKENATLKEEIKSLKDDLEYSNMYLQYYMYFYEKYNNVFEGEFIFDFAKQDVFSIERMPYSEQEDQKTIISFKDHESKIIEWDFYCSVDQHNRLVNQFLEHKKMLDTKTIL